MKDRKGLSFYLVNGITLYRVIAAPFLFALIFLDQPGIFKWALGISFFTDAIDGYFARRYRVVSVFGAKMDSLGDDLTIAAAITATFVYHLSFLKEEIYILGTVFTIYLLQMSLSFFKYRRLTSFHTYQAKLAAVLQGLFFLVLFFLGKPDYALFYLAAGVTAFQLMEEIILVLLLPVWRTDVKGLYWLLKERAGQRYSGGI